MGTVSNAWHFVANDFEQTAEVHKTVGGELMVLLVVVMAMVMVVFMVVVVIEVIEMVVAEVVVLVMLILMLIRMLMLKKLLLLLMMLSLFLPGGHGSARGDRSATQSVWSVYNPLLLHHSFTGDPFLYICLNYPSSVHWIEPIFPSCAYLKQLYPLLPPSVLLQ